MRDWFRDTYGALPFSGYRIMWNSFTPATAPPVSPDTPSAEERG
jgi:hypothetical protein